eukprot:737782_1
MPLATISNTCVPFRHLNLCDTAATPLIRSGGHPEDPIAHSNTDAFLPIIGNVGSFLFRLYPNPALSSEFTAMFIVKVFLVPLSVLCGCWFGRQIVHKKCLQKWMRLKMFARDKGTWFVMFFTTVLVVFVFSQLYNSIIETIQPGTRWKVNAYIGLTNRNFMKLTA